MRSTAPTRAARAWHVACSPRTIGTRCGVNSTSTGAPPTLRERQLDLRGVPVREQAVGDHALVGLGEVAADLQPAPGARDAPTSRRRSRAARRARPRTAAPARGAPRSGSTRARRRGRRRAARRGRARRARTRSGRSARARCARRRTTARTSSAGSRKSAPRSTTCATSSTMCGHESLRRAVGHREEHDVEPRHRGRIHRPVREARVRRRERRVEVGDLRPGVAVGGDVHDVDVGVRREQSQQLGACVP